MARILIIEAFYGGSHKQLVDLLMCEFDGEAEAFTLPAKKWHWRARAAALYLSQTLPRDHQYKVLFTSSVLNLAELVALRPDLGSLRKVLYFHENQLVYPVRGQRDRDFQYGYNQILSSLVADQVLFNSHFNLQSFLSNIQTFLKVMPDFRPKGLAEIIKPKCSVLYFPLMLPSMVATKTQNKQDEALVSSKAEEKTLVGPKAEEKTLESSKAEEKNLVISKAEDPLIKCLSSDRSKEKHSKEHLQNQDTKDVQLALNCSMAQDSKANIVTCEGIESELTSNISATIESGDFQGPSSKISKYNSDNETEIMLKDFDVVQMADGGSECVQKHSCLNKMESESLESSCQGVSDLNTASVAMGDSSHERTAAKQDCCDETLDTGTENADTSNEGMEVDSVRKQDLKPLKRIKKDVLHIVWPHRWEHDKNPELFFHTLLQLQSEGLNFQLSVLGETFTDVPDIFAESCTKLTDHTLHWGYLPDKSDYYTILSQADVVVSTAKHEFFGVAMLEAVHCGCFPLCPNRLVYPEIFQHADCLYNTDNQLLKKLRTFCKKPQLVRSKTLQFDLQRFSWEVLKTKYREILST